MVKASRIYLRVFARPVSVKSTLEVFLHSVIESELILL